MPIRTDNRKEQAEKFGALADSVFDADGRCCFCGTLRGGKHTSPCLGATLATAKIMMKEFVGLGDDERKPAADVDPKLAEVGRKAADEGRRTADAIEGLRKFVAHQIGAPADAKMEMSDEFILPNGVHGFEMNIPLTELLRGAVGGAGVFGAECQVDLYFTVCDMIEGILNGLSTVGPLMKQFGPDELARIMHDCDRMLKFSENLFENAVCSDCKGNMKHIYDEHVKTSIEWYKAKEDFHKKLDEIEKQFMQQPTQQTEEKPKP